MLRLAGRLFPARPRPALRPLPRAPRPATPLRAAPGAAQSGKEGQQAGEGPSGEAVLLPKGPGQEERAQRPGSKGGGVGAAEGTVRGTAAGASAPAAADRAASSAARGEPAPEVPQGGERAAPGPAAKPPSAAGGDAARAAQHGWDSSEHTNLSPDPSLLLAGGFLTPPSTFFGKAWPSACGSRVSCSAGFVCSAAHLPADGRLQPPRSPQPRRRTAAELGGPQAGDRGPGRAAGGVHHGACTPTGDRGAGFRPGPAHPEWPTRRACLSCLLACAAGRAQMACAQHARNRKRLQNRKKTPAGRARLVLPNCNGHELSGLHRRAPDRAACGVP
jgi:hypothetical protein